MDKELPAIDKSQLYYGKLAHIVAIAACFVSLTAQVLILSFPHSNLLNPNLIFGAIFEGKNPAEIWAVAGVSFKPGDFWKLFLGDAQGGSFTPDRLAIFGVTLGCSVTLWALIPAFFQFVKKREYFYVCVSLFVMGLIILAMSGVVNMAG